VDGATIDGTVISTSGSSVRIEIEDDTYDVGALVQIISSGQSIGEGILQLSEYESIYAPNGAISEIEVEENDSVEEGDALFTVISPNRKIAANYAEIEDMYEEMAQINAYDLYDAVYALEDGIVSSVNFSEDDLAEAFETVLTISSTKDYEIEVSLDIAYLEEVSLGQKATASFTNGITLDGSVGHIDYNASSEYFSITVKLDDCDEISEGIILPGMTADVSVVQEESLDTQMILASAVYSGQDGYYVFVDDGSERGQMTYITTGIINSQYVEVLSGLEATDEVIINE
jgi:hypothetical protein